MKGNRPAIINQRLLTSLAPPVTGDLDKKKCQLDQTFLRVLSNVRSISNHEDANPTDLDQYKQALFSTQEQFLLIFKHK